MEIKFTKMQGCGNDYIYINCMEKEISSPESLSVRLSNRHFGIGGDGMVLILPSKIADARMRMFNSDGSEGKMCGNAIRCVAKYLYDNQIVSKSIMNIETASGVKELFLMIKDSKVSKVKVNMGEAVLSPDGIPVNLPGKDIINKEIIIDGETYFITCVSMGNPHGVVFCKNIKNLDLEKIGPKFEHHLLFPERVNTEFVRVTDENILEMRVWERGSGETLACGTGACAAAVAAVLNGYCKEGKDIKVSLLGGELMISYRENVVFMTGECKKIYEGVIEI